MAESENSVEFDGTDIDIPAQEDFEEDVSFEGEELAGTSGEEFQARGRGRGNFR